MMERDGAKIDREEKLERLKDRLGWYFGEVAPINWNPYENADHAGYMLRTAAEIDASREFFSELLKNDPLSLLLMPFNEDGREELCDLCGCLLGCWFIDRSDQILPCKEGCCECSCDRVVTLEHVVAKLQKNFDELNVELFKSASLH